MSNVPIVFPLLAQVFLTFALMILMAVKRVTAAQARRYKLRDIALDGHNYPADIQKYGNAFRNQFELPVLFYLLCVLLILDGQGNASLFVTMASLFVAGRYLHAFIHVTSNNVIKRFYAFLAGAILLVGMWGVFVVQQLSN